MTPDGREDVQETRIVHTKKNFVSKENVAKVSEILFEKNYKVSRFYLHFCVFFSLTLYIKKGH